MYNEAKGEHAVDFINCLKHTKYRWVPFGQGYLKDPRGQCHQAIIQYFYKIQF
ncbi:hypothetical protein [Clostridium tetani]|uniref:hypothetical protein n=1 Tax=Clostridium tetani TaxID=1513 RepID=UPI002955677C|nr:hypothetical protein [Clostridium tetani]BDR76120.1 hypothetical protein K154306013_17800 [Clostridium tetani]